MDLRDLNRSIFFLANTVAFDGNQLTGTLYVIGADTAWLWTWFDRIENYLTHAARAAGPSGYGSRVTVTAMRSPEHLCHLDVTGGTIRPNTLFPSGVEMTCDVTLDCLPLVRDEPYSVPVASFQNGATGIYLEAVPGTAPALLGFDFTDISGSTIVVNELMIGVRGDRELASSGFVGVIDAGAPGSGGGGADSGASGFIGGSARTVITNETWRDICGFTIPYRGEFEVWARIKDPSAANNSDPLKELSLSTTATGGALGTGAWSYVLAALDASDNVIAVSPLKSTTAYAGATNSNHLAWVAVTGATKYRPYYKHDAGAWSYMATTTATSYTHVNETGAVVSDPPSAPSPAVANALFRLTVALPGGQVVKEYDAVPSELANNTWEDICVADGPFPPAGRYEGESDPSTAAGGQATSGGTNTPTVSWDAVWLMPKGKATAWYDGFGLGTKSRWLLTPDREGTLTGRLADTTTGAVTGSLCVSGCPKAWPGNNVVVIKMRVQGMASDVANAAISGSVTVWPRRRWLGGVPWAT